MSGMKGRSGGPRKNSGGARPNSGGRREGAGRKPNPVPEPILQTESDMLRLLKDIAMGKTEATAIQVRAAIAAVQYTHRKIGEGGKKDEKQAKAKSASEGRFAAIGAPRLVVNNVNKA